MTELPSVLIPNVIFTPSLLRVRNVPESIDPEPQLTVHCDRLKKGAGDCMVTLDGTQTLADIV